MALFNKNDILNGGLTDFSVADTSESFPEDGGLLFIGGRKLGLIAWILETIGISDPSFNFSLSKDFVTISASSNQFTMLPTQEIHSVSVGYTRNKVLLLLAIAEGAASLFLFLGNLTAGHFFEAFTLLFLGAIIAGVLFYAYKLSERLEFLATLVSADHTRTTVGIRVKSTSFGEMVNSDQVQKALVMMRSVCLRYSKFYQ